MRSSVRGVLSWCEASAEKRTAFATSPRRELDRWRGIVEDVFSGSAASAAAGEAWKATFLRSGGRAAQDGRQ